MCAKPSTGAKTFHFLTPAMLSTIAKVTPPRVLRTTAAETAYPSNHHCLLHIGDHQFMIARFEDVFEPAASCSNDVFRALIIGAASWIFSASLLPALCSDTHLVGNGSARVASRTL
jgi:hypothetical protein